MVFYLVRHGETDWNAEGIVQGNTDIPLNARGLEQAASAREEMKDVPLDVIYCSPLIRARVTAEIINEYHHVPLILDARLREREFGVYEGRPYGEYPSRSFWNYEEVFHAEGAETIREVYARVYACLDEIRAAERGKCVMLTMHGGAARAVYSYFYKLKADEQDKTVLAPNAVPIRFEIEDDAPLPTPIP